MKPLLRCSNDLRPAARALRPVVGALLVASVFGVQAQQWTAGQTLWQANGCVACHTARFPLSLMNTAYANNAVALSRLDNAIATLSDMAVYRTGGGSALSAAQRDSLSYFISNFRAEPNAAPQSSTALQANAEVVIRLFNNGKRPLQIAANSGITLTGANANQFSVRGINNTCFGLVVAPAAFCELAVRYQPAGAASAAHTASLVISHNGEPQNTSTVTITGAVAPSPSPTPAPSPSPSPAPAPAPSSGGGGALPLTLWAALLPAALFARRRRG